MRILYNLTLVLVVIFLGISCSGEKEIPADRETEIDISGIPKQYQNLLHKEFGPENFPEGFVEQSGYVMGFIEGDEYIIDHVTSDTTNLLWFCKLTGRDLEGRPILKILDLMILPSLQENEQLVMGNCQYKGTDDPEIISIVRFREKQIEGEVQQAWRANRANHKFEKISSENVNCVNESFYL